MDRAHHSQLKELLLHLAELKKRLDAINVIKLAAKEEAAEGHRIPKEIQKELIRKKRQQKQTEAAPSEKGYRKGQRAEA